MRGNETELSQQGETKSFPLVVHDPSRDVAVVRGLVQADENGRLRLMNLEVVPVDDRHIDVALWRSVPIAAIETAINSPEHRQRLLNHLDRHVRGFYELQWNVDLAIARMYNRGNLLRRQTPHKKGKPPIRLPKPKGQRYPDRHYERVADAYYRLVEEGRPPAQTLAEANGVPVTTVTRWFKEARSRGLMAPAGGKGRIG